MNDVVLQCILASAMLIVTILAGLVPLKVCKKLILKGGVFSQRSAKLLTMLTCFGGGVFLATCFLDIFPHMTEQYEEVQKLMGRTFGFPFVYFLVCIGFFLVYSIEEVTMKVFGMQHSHGHEHSSPHNDEKKGSTAAIVEDSRSSNWSIDDDSMPKISHHDIIDESVKYMTTEEPKQASILKTITFAFVMSFHSILEGIALGVQDTKASIINLFISLLLHKAIEAFTVGIQISKSNTERTRLVVITIVLYAIMTPLGSILGVAIKNSSINEVVKEVICTILEALACGTFLYVAIVEIIATEKMKQKYPIMKLLAMFTGFMVISAFQSIDIIMGTGHGHTH
uniref:Zinc transporter ZIP3 n=1 Tax=Rhabditophanes sp. KR3021 TaxID=114890 RepID=A0AC35UF84_9BILA